MPARNTLLTAESSARLLAAARAARPAAYAPYSGFAVGAAVLARDGRVFCGVNVENASYGATLCAERVAAASAIASGVREILAVAVVGPGGKPCPPCGICRQFLAEFGPSMEIILEDGRGGLEVHELAELLPGAFLPQHLDEAGPGKTGAGR